MVLLWRMKNEHTMHARNAIGWMHRTRTLSVVDQQDPDSIMVNLIVCWSLVCLACLCQRRMTKSFALALPAEPSYRNGCHRANIGFIFGGDCEIGRESRKGMNNRNRWHCGESERFRLGIVRLTSISKWPGIIYANSVKISLRLFSLHSTFGWILFFFWIDRFTNSTIDRHH